MYGFFTWSDADDDILNVADQVAVICPNCGVRCLAGKASAHACARGDVDKHHARLLAMGFQQVLHPRNAVPDDRRLSDDENTHLWLWLPFMRWLNTPAGIFAVRYAQRERP